MDNQKDMIIGQDFHNFVRLKTHKLCSAIYLVTDFLPNNEPLKWRLRARALSLMSDTCNHYGHDKGHILPNLEIAMSLIDIARLNPGASPENFKILKEEYAHLRQTILQNQTKQPLLTDLPIPAISLSAHKNGPVEPRRRLILDFISQNGWSSIKDIAKAVPGVSSKTVQRELSSLVGTGLLKKEGQKRWSRYLTVSSH